MDYGARPVAAANAMHFLRYTSGEQVRSRYLWEALTRRFEALASGSTAEELTRLIHYRNTSQALRYQFSSKLSSYHFLFP